MTIFKRAAAAICAAVLLCACVCGVLLRDHDPIPLVSDAPAVTTPTTQTTTETRELPTQTTVAPTTQPTAAPVLQTDEVTGETVETVLPSDTMGEQQDTPSPETTDSDGDGLSDADEEQVLGTDPEVYDTDSDGARDGFEAQLGTDPLTPDEAFDVTQSHHIDGDAVEVTVEATLSGEQAETLDVRPASLQTLFPDTMPGYIGAAYDISVDGDAEDTTVSFMIDAQSDVVDPTIYYFDAATQTVTPVPTTVENGIATAAVTPNATYVLLDRAIYEGSLSWEDTWSVSDVHTAAEVVLVIDDSASMSKTDAAYQRLTVAADLIDRLPEDSRVGVVGFSSETTIFTETLTDVATAKATLTTTNFLSQGGTRMYTAVHDALTLFDSAAADVQRVMVVLSDGIAVDHFNYDDIVQTVTDNDICMFTVGFDGSYERFLRSLGTFAEDTGGSFYYAENADELTFVYDDISDMIDLSLDTDGDTIPDYYEDHAVAFNGTTIALDKTKTDTDYDGIADNDEVSVELIYSDDNTQVYVKGMMLSDPTTADSDYDGTTDDADGAPFDRTFSGTLTTEYATSSVSFEMDYSWFFGDNTVYDAGLSKASILLSAVAYAESSLSLSDAASRTTAGATTADVLSYLGMLDPQTYLLSTDYTDNHLSEATVGYRNVVHNGELKTVLAIVVRGTNKSIEEWSSNCDIGNLAEDTDSDDWINTDNHKGFDVAANRIMRYVEQYIADHALYGDALVYWVTGHSRGGGIANIIGAQLEKDSKTAFTYTFAAPNNTLAADAASYVTIFNVINKDDFVPCLPIDQWGYTRYGVSTGNASIMNSYETQWESLTGIFDYNPTAHDSLASCVSTLAGIIPAGSDPRISSYQYTCSCHGDGSNDTITATNAGMYESSRENAIAKIPSNALPYCIITRYDGGFLSGWDFDVCQTPAYFMQLLAAFMGGEINAYRFAFELNYADRYADAKGALVSVGISGVEHAHYTESYYVLAENVTAADFS